MGISGLYVGLSGLQSASNSLNTTANNLSNVNTTGYVRQQVVYADRSYNSVMTTSRTTTGQSGLGVSIATINHVRDTFLDASYRKEVGRENYYDKVYEAVYEIETQMGESDFISGIGFQDAFSDIYSALNEVAKAPTDQTSRSALVQSAVTFLNEAQTIYNGLADYQINLNQEVTDTVNRINEIGERLVDLNQRITKIEAGNIEEAMDYRDERDTLLDELAKYTKISYSEDDMGVVTVSIEGTMFADNLSYNKIGLEKVSGTDFVNPVWSSMDNQPLYNLNNTISTEKNTDIGSLKGLLVARGTVAATAYSMETPDAADYPDPDDYTAAVKAHEEYLTSAKVSNLVNTMANFDKLVSTMVQEINNVLCPETTVTAADGTEYTVLDTENAPVNSKGQMGIELFSRNFNDRYKEQTIDGKTYYVRNGVDEYGNLSNYSINNISVNTSILQDYSLIPLTEQDGSASYDRAQQMVDLFEKDLLTYNGGSDGLTFEQFYETMTNDNANTGSICSSMVDNETTLANQIDSARQEVLGVSSDDELSNMIRYQQAYNASSRFINVESDMLEQLIMNLF